MRLPAGHSQNFLKLRPNFIASGHCLRETRAMVYALVPSVPVFCQEAWTMVRISRLVAMLAAVVMTAFTFGLIGQGAGHRSHVPARRVAAQLVSAMHRNSDVLARELARI
jgi:hypothetical protein